MLMLASEGAVTFEDSAYRMTMVERMSLYEALVQFKSPDDATANGT